MMMHQRCQPLDKIHNLAKSISPATYFGFETPKPFQNFLYDLPLGAYGYFFWRDIYCDNMLLIIQFQKCTFHAWLSCVTKCFDKLTGRESTISL